MRTLRRRDADLAVDDESAHQHERLPDDDQSPLPLAEFPPAASPRWSHPSPRNKLAVGGKLRRACGDQHRLGQRLSHHPRLDDRLGQNDGRHWGSSPDFHGAAFLHGIVEKVRSPFAVRRFVRERTSTFKLRQPLFCTAVKSFSVTVNPVDRIQSLDRQAASHSRPCHGMTTLPCRPALPHGRRLGERIVQYSRFQASRVHAATACFTLRFADITAFSGVIFVGDGLGFHEAATRANSISRIQGRLHLAERRNMRPPVAPDTAGIDHKEQIALLKSAPSAKMNSTMRPETAAGS